MSKSTIRLIFYIIAILLIQLTIVNIRIPARAGTLLAINALALSRKPILLTLLKPTQIVTIALTVAQCLPSMLIAIQTTCAAVSVPALLVDSNPSSVQRLYSRMSRNDYCLNRQNLTLFYRLPFYLSTRVGLQKSINPRTGMSTIESIPCTFLNTRIADSQATLASATLFSTLRYVCKLRIHLGSLSSLIYSTKLLLWRISEPLLTYLITPRPVGSLTRLLAPYYHSEVYLPIVLV